MGLGTVITMGVIGFGGSIVTHLLFSQGEAKKAQLVDIAVTAMLISTVVSCVTEAITQLYKLVG